MGKDDRLALVTGTSSGLGAAISGALLRSGWTVVGMSRRRVVNDSPNYKHIQVDLAEIDDLIGIAGGQLVPILRRRDWHRVGLVNNAGAVGAMVPLEDIHAGDLVRSFAVNAIAPIYLMGVVIKETPASTPLRIVNVSTGAAVKAFPGLSDYGSGKAALRHAGMMLAAELESAERPGGPRVNASIMNFHPGVVDTPMQETARASQHPWFRLFRELHAHGELTPPEKPARDVVEFLVGDTKAAFNEKRFSAGGS